MYKKARLFTTESTTPIIGDYCVNSIGMTFKWSNMHIEHDVRNTLVEYKNIRVIHFHVDALEPNKTDGNNLVASSDNSYKLPTINRFIIEELLENYNGGVNTIVNLEYETMYKNQKYGFQPFPDETCTGHELKVKVYHKDEVFIKLIKENFSRERVIELLNQLASDYVYFYDGLDENNKVKTSWLDENLDN